MRHAIRRVVAWTSATTGIYDCQCGARVEGDSAAYQAHRREAGAPKADRIKGLEGRWASESATRWNQQGRRKTA